MVINIGIIGGGISGLALASFLVKIPDINVIVLEKNVQDDFSRDGFSLTLQGSTKDIMKEYNMYDSVIMYGCRSKKQTFYNENGEVLYYNSSNDEERFNYPIPRKSLKQIFKNKIGYGNIIYDRNVVSVEKVIDKIKVSTVSKSGYMYQYNFSNIFVCDGIGSKIRSQFHPNIKLNSLGLFNVYGIVPFSKLDADTKKVFYETEVQVLGSKFRLFSKPYDLSHQMWEMTWILDDDDKKLYNLQKSGININELSFSKCIEKMSDSKIQWIKNLVDATDPRDLIVHGIYDIDPRTINQTMQPEGILFIGDTIHPMSPYKGMGANSAITSAYEYAKVVEECEDYSKLHEKLLKKSIQVNNDISKIVRRSREITEFYHSDSVLDKEKLYKFKKW